MRRGLHRREPRIGDRRGRQSRNPARVVRRGAVDLRLPDRLRRRNVEPVAQRRVDPERHSCVEPVVDHRGHERTLVRRERLLLDHRRDDQNVIRGQVLAVRIAEVDAAPVLAERRELVLDELGVGRPSEELVAGKRKPSRLFRLPRRQVGGAARRTAAPYPRDEIRGVTWRSFFAICRTAPTRAVISCTVKPSGKTMWNGFGIAITVTVSLPFVVRVTVL